MAKKRTTNPNNYSEKDIEVLEGAEAVRAKPGMYMGERGDQMIYHQFKELADNAIDEHSAGRNKGVEFVFNEDENVHIVADCAQGIPVGNNKKTGLSTLELVLTRLHAGGKMRADNTAYKSSAGTHGVGAMCSNAISEWFQVYTQREGTWYFQSYEKGFPTSKVKKVRKPEESIRNQLSKPITKYGTLLIFKPDQSIVSVDATNKRAKKLTPAKMPVRQALNWGKMISLMNPGLEVVVTSVSKNKTVKFKNTKDISLIIDKLVEDNELTRVGKPFVYQSEMVDCTIQWTSHDNTDLFKSYVNCSPTAEHGKHYKGFFDALTRALSKYKTQKDKFKTDDAMHGMVGALNFKMSGAEFSSQTKDKLTSHVNKDVEQVLYDAIVAYFEKNPQVPKKVVQRANQIAKGRDELKKVMKSVSSVNKSKKGAVLTNVLVTSTTNKPEERELYFVEGDSAGGTAKKARFSQYQEVMQLTGKVSNALTTDIVKLIGSKKIQELLVALGIDTTTLNTDEDLSKMHFSTKKLRIGKVFMLSDADVDGGHINALLLTLIYRLVPDLIRENRVFVVDAPLYSAFFNNKRYFGETFEDCAKQLPSNAPKHIVSRAKGWGEINPDMLRFIAFDPNHRKVLRVKYPESSEAREYFRAIMGPGSATRKELIGYQ